ncbi:mucin-2 [Streptomyces sp. NPDC001492]
MPWFKVDDTAHAHPKMRRAGKSAIGLWVMCGSYAAAYLTDGVVPAETAAEGTQTQIAKLLKAGLWHEHGHGCSRCAQPMPGDFVMHDYLRYNPSRARVLAEREREAEKKRAQRAGGQPDGTPPPRNGHQNGSDFGGKTEEKPEFFDGFSSPVSGKGAGQNSMSHGDSEPPHARASRPAPTQAVATDVATAASWADRKNGFPDALQPLAQELAAAGLGAVAWDIKKFSDWERIRIQVERLGVDLMVRSATNAAQQRGEPDSVVAWIGRWESLQPEPAGRPQLRAVSGGWTGPNRPHPATGAAAPTPTADDYKNARPF